MKCADILICGEMKIDIPIVSGEPTTKKDNYGRFSENLKSGRNCPFSLLAFTIYSCGMGMYMPSFAMFDVYTYVYGASGRIQDRPWGPPNRQPIFFFKQAYLKI